MSIDRIEVIQGDLTDILEVSPFEEGEETANLSDAGWTCKSAVIKEMGDVPIFERDITDKTVDDLYFRAAIDPDDTTVLAVDSYIWVIQIENLLVLPKFRREKQVELVVEPQALT